VKLKLQTKHMSHSNLPQSNRYLMKSFFDFKVSRVNGYMRCGCQVWNNLLSNDEQKRAKMKPFDLN